MAYNTNNPVGSNDPRDLDDNSKTLDLMVNSDEDVAVTRLGKGVYTLAYLTRMIANGQARVDGIVSSVNDYARDSKALIDQSSSGVTTYASNAKLQIDQRVGQVDDAGDSAEAQMVQTAANLGADLNNKRYATDAAMRADPQTRDAVVGFVDADPNPSLNGWSSWNNTTKKWVRFVEQPASSTALQKLADDPQRPRAIEAKGVEEELLISLTDAEGRRTWMEALLRDGGPSEWALGLIRERLGAVLRGYPGMLLAATDANGYLTDWCVRDTDGQVPDWVIERWAVRLLPILAPLLEPKRVLPFYYPDYRGTNFQINGGDSYVRGAEVLPVLPNMQRWAGWGSSTIAQFHEMSGLAQQMGATYYNGGQGSEASTHIAARMGSVPALLTVIGGVIPAAAGSTVTLSCSNVAPIQYFRPTQGYLNGVKGTLSSTDAAFSFKREAAGSDVPSVGEFAFCPIDGPDHRADVTFLNMGKNDNNYMYETAGVIARIDASYDWLAPMVKRVIVVGQFKNVGTQPGSFAARALTEIDAYCQKRYGRQFYDLGAYLSSAQVWADTGITPTQADLDQQALGNLAPSLSLDNAAHMNPKTRAAVAAQLKAKVLELGWYA